MVWLLQANPVVGKDQPPDLAVYVPSNSVVIPELPNNTPSAQASPPKNVSAEKTKPVASRMTLIFSGLKNMYQMSMPL